MNLTFPAIWARLAYRTVKKWGKHGRVDLTLFGSSEEQLFGNNMVTLGAWLHINQIGVENIPQYEVQLAKVAHYSIDHAASKIASQSVTIRECLIQLSNIARKIDDGINVRIVDDGEHIWLNCHYELIRGDLIKCWSPSSAMIPYSLVNAACGYEPDCLLGFTYEQMPEFMPFDRAEQYGSELFLNQKVIFDVTTDLFPLNGYFIRWRKEDIDQLNAVYNPCYFDANPHERPIYEVTTADKVLSVMREKLRRLTCDQVADLMGMSDRELRRRLKEEGKSFSSISDEHLIGLYSTPKFNTMPMAEAASLLGYGSGSSLKRSLLKAGYSP